MLKPTTCIGARAFMRVATLAAFALAGLGCVNLSYEPTDPSAHYTPSTQVEVFWEEPDRSYSVIGRISASSEDYGEEDLIRRIKAHAAQEGAHAVIVGSTSENSSVVLMPMATGGTMIIPVTNRAIEALAIRWADEQ